MIKKRLSGGVYCDQPEKSKKKARIAPDYAGDKWDSGIRTCCAQD